MSYLTDPHSKAFPPRAGNVSTTPTEAEAWKLAVESALSDLRTAVNRLTPAVAIKAQMNFSTPEGCRFAPWHLNW